MHSHRLRTLRQAKGLTLDQLSAASGIHRGTIHRIELGQVSPRVDTLNDLCTALGAELQHLFVKLPLEAEPGVEMGFKRGMLEWMGHLEALIQHSPDALMVLDRKGSVLYESQGANGLFGTDSAGRRALTWADWVHPEERPALENCLQLLLADPGSLRSLDYRVPAGRGQWRWVTSNCSNQLDHPIIQGIIVSSQDTSRHKGTETELQARILRLQELVDALPGPQGGPARGRPASEVYLLLAQDGTILECQASPASHPLGAFSASIGANLRALPLPAEVLAGILAMVAEAFAHDGSETRSFALEVDGVARLQEVRVKCNAGPVALLRLREITPRS